MRHIISLSGRVLCVGLAFCCEVEGFHACLVAEQARAILWVVGKASELFVQIIDAKLVSRR